MFTPGVDILSVISGHVRTLSANERRRYICNVISHWLRSFTRDQSQRIETGPRCHPKNGLGELSLSGVPDLFDRNKILSGGDLSHYQVPHCIRVFFYFV